MPRHCWWRQGGEEKNRAQDLIEETREIESKQAEWYTQAMQAATLYYNRELQSFRWGVYRSDIRSLRPRNLVSENLIDSLGRAYAATVAKDMPKPTPQTFKANYRLQREARKLEKELFGRFTQGKLWEKTFNGYIHSYICGVGFVQVEVTRTGDDDAVVRYLPVSFDDVVIDNNDVDDELQPTTVRIRRLLPRWAVYANYGESYKERTKRELRLDFDSGRTQYISYRPNAEDYVAVVSAWRKPHGSEPGRYVVACQDAVLVDEEFVGPHFPLTWFHWNQPPPGYFYCNSGVETVLPYQIRLNEINDVIRDAQDLMARPRILVANGSQINPQHIDDVTGRIIKYTGIKPEALVWPAVSAELYRERDRVVEAAFRFHALSDLVAQSNMPTRLESMPAMQKATDIHSGIHIAQAKRYEEWHLHIARVTIQELARIGAEADEIDWKRLQDGTEDFRLFVQPTSVFEMSPAARTDTLERWLGAGLISPDEYKEMVGNPDLENHISLQTAAANDLRLTFERLEDGEWVPPQRYQDLVNGVPKAQMRLMELRNTEEVSNDVILAFINWIAQAQAILNEAQQQMAPPPAQEMQQTGVMPSEPGTGTIG